MHRAGQLLTADILEDAGIEEGGDLGASQAEPLQVLLLKEALLLLEASSSQQEQTSEVRGSLQGGGTWPGLQQGEQVGECTGLL